MHARFSDRSNHGTSKEYGQYTGPKNKKGLRETLIGGAEKEPYARNSEGDLRKYRRTTHTTGNPLEIRPRNAEQLLQCKNCFEFGHKARDPKSGKHCTKPPARTSSELTAWQLDLAKKIRKEYNERKKQEKERKEAARKKAEAEKEKPISID